MTFRIGLAQCTHPHDGNVVALVESFAAQAQARSVDLLVFPECLMTPFEKTREDFIASAQPLDGPFASEMGRIAAKHSLWIVYTLNEQANPHGGEEHASNSASASPLPHNTAVIVDSTGTHRGFYRKTHLFDAGAYRESDRMQRGDRLFEPIATPFCTLGVAICYDLRFPEVARKAACAGCELLIVPAAWVDGANKALQWKALLTARAVENEMFVAGLSRADKRYVGQSRVIDPYGVTIAEASGKQSVLITADLDTELVRTARTNMPVFEHRRRELY